MNNLIEFQLLLRMKEPQAMQSLSLVTRSRSDKQEQRTRLKNWVTNHVNLDNSAHGETLKTTNLTLEILKGGSTCWRAKGNQAVDSEKPAEVGGWEEWELLLVPPEARTSYKQVSDVMEKIQELFDKGHIKYKAPIVNVMMVSNSSSQIVSQKGKEKLDKEKKNK